MMSDQEALNQLLDDFGYADVEDMAKASLFDGTNGGICKECGYSTDVEPDNGEGWCEVCEDTTVVSGMILAGIF